MQNEQEVSLDDISVGKNLMKRFDDGEWYASTITAIESHPSNHERIFTLTFADGEVENHGRVSLNRLFRENLLRK